MRIKTRESMQSIKTLDRTESLAGKTKSGLSEMGKQAEDTRGGNYASATDYAGGQVEMGEEKAIQSVLYGARRVGEWGIRETGRNIRKWRNRPKKLKVPNQKRLQSPKRPSLPQPKKNPVKTTQNTAKAAKTTAKTAKATAKAAQAAAKAAKAAVKATIQFIKVAAKAIVAVAKVVVAAVKGIIAAIAAGGWIAVLVIVLICLVGGVIGYVCHIFSADDDGGYSVRYMMTTCEQEYRMTENNLILSTPHDEMVIVGDEPDMKLILAVYAVLAGVPEGDFPTAAEDDRALVEEVFDAMYSISSATSEREATVLREYVDAQGNTYEVEETVVQTVLTIERYTMTADEAAVHFNMDRRQREHLDTLLGVEFDEMWEALLY